MSYKSTAPGGYGSVTKHGYLRVFDPIEKKQKLEHRLVWEWHKGPLTRSDRVYHLNGNKLDNHIDNLTLLPPSARPSPATPPTTH